VCVCVCLFCACVSVYASACERGRRQKGKSENIQTEGGGYSTLVLIGGEKDLTLMMSADDEEVSVRKLDPFQTCNPSNSVEASTSVGQEPVIILQRHGKCGD